MSVTSHQPTPQRLEEAERLAGRVAPGYLEQVREVAGRLALRESDRGDAMAAVNAVEELSVIDLHPPTSSRIPIARLVKQTVKRLVFWYLGYFGHQVTALGQAVANLGRILAERIERLEGDSVALRGELSRLEARVARLEASGGGGTGPGPEPRPGGEAEQP